MAAMAAPPGSTLPRGSSFGADATIPRPHADVAPPGATLPRPHAKVQPQPGPPGGTLFVGSLGGTIPEQNPQRSQSEKPQERTPKRKSSKEGQNSEQPSPKPPRPGSRNAPHANASNAAAP